MPYPKRDVVKSPISFGFHGKLEAVGFCLAESYLTKFNETFFIVVSTILSKDYIDKNIVIKKNIRMNYLAISHKNSCLTQGLTI